MATVYACTHVTKEVERHPPCVGGRFSRVCVLDEPINVIARSVIDLIEQINGRYGFEIKGPCLVIDHTADHCWMDWHCTEDGDGNADPNGKFMAEWSFRLEKRETYSVKVADFAGVKCHSIEE